MLKNVGRNQCVKNTVKSLFLNFLLEYWIFFVMIVKTVIKHLFNKGRKADMRENHKCFEQNFNQTKSVQHALKGEG